MADPGCSLRQPEQTNVGGSLEFGINFSVMIRKCY